MTFPVDKDYAAECDLPPAAEDGRGVTGSACSSVLGHTGSHTAEPPNVTAAVPFSVTDLHSSQKVKDI